MREEACEAGVGVGFEVAVWLKLSQEAEGGPHGGRRLCV